MVRALLRTSTTPQTASPVSQPRLAATLASSVRCKLLAPIGAVGTQGVFVDDDSTGSWMTDVASELAHGNGTIDKAAAETGRDPREIRRLFDFAGTFGPAGRGFVHGPPEQWASNCCRS